VSESCKYCFGDLEYRYRDGGWEGVIQAFKTSQATTLTTAEEQAGEQM